MFLNLFSIDIVIILYTAITIHFRLVKLRSFNTEIWIFVASNVSLLVVVTRKLIIFSVIDFVYFTNSVFKFKISQHLSLDRCWLCSESCQLGCQHTNPSTAMGHSRLVFTFCDTEPVATNSGTRLAHGGLIWIPWFELHGLNSVVWTPWCVCNIADQFELFYLCKNSFFYSFVLINWQEKSGPWYSSVTSAVTICIFQVRFDSIFL